MMFRSVTSRLVFLYCLLLVILGGAFLGFTVLSFDYFARETTATALSNRAGEVWNISQSLLDQPARLGDVIGRLFSPEPLDRFIRIRAGGRTLYQSGAPENHEFDPGQVP